MGSELFDFVDGEVKDSDDVMVVNEFPSTLAMKKRKHASSRVTRDVLRDHSDVDCVVLDADPENRVSVAKDYRDGYGSDDLLIVGEKGQLACRDFPHSRHLCAHFPFSTTPHKKHCDQCYCYVCDSPAPCIYWGNGVSMDDHCHSTDKEGKWKAQRKSSKRRKMETSSDSQTLSDAVSKMATAFSEMATVYSQMLSNAVSKMLTPRIVTHSRNSTTISSSLFFGGITISSYNASKMATSHSQNLSNAISIMPRPRINTQSHNSTTIPSSNAWKVATVQSQKLSKVVSKTPPHRYNTRSCNSTTIPSSNARKTVTSHSQKPSNAISKTPPPRINTRSRNSTTIPSSEATIAKAFHNAISKTAPPRINTHSRTSTTIPSSNAWKRK